MAVTGTRGNYTLTATVAGAGGAAPTGTVSFLDKTESNALLGSASLVANPAGFAFATPQAEPPIASNLPLSVAIGDLNGDGIPDLISGYHYIYPDGSNCNNYFLSEYTDRAETLLGNGDGTYTAGQTDLQVTCEPTSVVVADFNGDGFADLAFGSYSSVNFGPSVLLGDGTGHFTPASSSPQLAGPLLVADFNGDGILDIAQPTGVSLGDGTGNFPTNISHSGLKPIVAGDFNGDGILDLAGVLINTSNPNQSSLQILLGAGDGSFVASTATPPITGNLQSIVAADFNNDGKLDLAVLATFSPVVDSANASSSITILTGDGAGNFTAAAPIVLADPSSASIGMGIGDFNGDGIADIVVNGGDTLPTSPGNEWIGSKILLGDGTGAFHLQTPIYTSPSDGYVLSNIVLGDLNGDGIPDLVSAIPNTSVLELLVGNQSAVATATSISPSPVGSGTHLAVASFVGDSAYFPSISPWGDLTTAQGTPQVTLSAPANPAPIGSVTLIATVTGAGDQPTGTVNFFNGVTPLGSATLVKGVATFDATTLTAGTYSLTATYPGDSNYVAATSNSFQFTVTAFATPTIALTASTTSTPYGTPVTFTATVAGSQGTPTGSVTFSDGTGTLGTVLLNGNGVATYTASLLTPGKYTVTVSYPGNTVYAPASSSPVSVTVNYLQPTITLTSPAPVNAGVPFSFTATLAGGGAIPTGTVSFLAGTTLLGKASLNSQGVATLLFTLSTPGQTIVTAVYSGDGNYTSATSSPATINVIPPITITSPSATLYSGTTNTITVTPGAISGKAIPTGAITLSATGYTSAATPLAAGSASIIIPANALPAGNDALTATYSGDSVYPASTGSIQIQVTATPPAFAVNGSANAITLAAGATTGNTLPITVTPQTGFTGSVALAAAISSSPAGAIDLPTLSFGSTSPVVISGTAPGTATLTITTTATTTTTAQSFTPSHDSWYKGGSLVLAALILWGMPARRLRSYKLYSILLFLICAGALVGCGGRSSNRGGSTGPTIHPGTTPGAYQIKITATSGSVSTDSTITLTVQ